MKNYSLSELIEYYAYTLHNPKLSPASRERNQATLNELLGKQRPLGLISDEMIER